MTLEINYKKEKNNNTTYGSERTCYWTNTGSQKKSKGKKPETNKMETQWSHIYEMQQKHSLEEVYSNTRKTPQQNTKVKFNNTVKESHRWSSGIYTKRCKDGLIYANQSMWYNT